MKVAFYLPPFIFILLVMLNLVRTLVIQHKYNVYLRNHHFEKWKELTTILGFGPGMRNSYRQLKFLFSNDDLGDPKVLSMKATFRNSILYLISGTVGLFIIWAFIVKLANK